MTAHELLKSARARLLESGWTQGRYHDKETGSVCVLGALGYRSDGRRLVFYPEQEYAIVLQAEQALQWAIGKTATVALWNDHIDRTFDEVIAVFDAAIEATRPVAVDEVEERELVPA